MTPLGFSSWRSVPPSSVVCRLREETPSQGRLLLHGLVALCGGDDQERNVPSGKRCRVPRRSRSTQSACSGFLQPRGPGNSFPRSPVGGQRQARRRPRPAPGVAARSNGRYCPRATGHGEADTELEGRFERELVAVLGEEAWELERATGSTMTLEQAITVARFLCRPPSARSADSWERWMRPPRVGRSRPGSGESVGECGRARRRPRYGGDRRSRPAGDSVARGGAAGTVRGASAQARPSMGADRCIYRRALRDGRRPLAQRRRPAARLDEASAYEERYLFLLFLLRQPRARVIYVTSEAVQPNLIDYYVGLLPGVVASHARARLYLVSPHDGGPAPLSAKLLERPRLLDEIRSLAGDPDVPTSFRSVRRDSSEISPFGSGSRCTAPIRSSPRWERRAADVRCSPRPVSRIQRAERACAPATTSSTRCSSWWRRGRASSPGPEARRGGIRVWQRRARCARAERGGSSQGRAAAKRASP